MFLDDNLIFLNPGKGLSFVQLYVNENPILIASSQGHIKTFELGLNQLNLPIEYGPLQKIILKSQNYYVAGMGRGWIDKNMVKVSGESFDYQMKPSNEHLKKLINILEKNNSVWRILMNKK